MDEARSRALEDKVRRGRLDLINVPYERAALSDEIENYETKIGRAVTMAMKSQSGLTNDPILRSLKGKQLRLKKLQRQLDELETKKEEERELKQDEEMSNEASSRMNSSATDPVEVSQAQARLYEEVSQLQKVQA